MSIAIVKKSYEDAILDGMARALWITAFATWAEDNDWSGSPGGGEDWDDVAPETPEAAELAAKALVKLIAANEGLANEKTPMAELFGIAMEAHRGEPYGYDLEYQHQDDPKDPDEDAPTDDAVAREFGHLIAMQCLGHGVAWDDDHVVKRGNVEFKPKLPRFESHYDGEYLTWSGGSEQAIGPRVPGIIYLNEGDAGTPGRRGHTDSVLLRFGPATRYFLWYGGLEDGVDALIDWVSENEPDSLANDAHDDVLRQALTDAGIDPDSDIDWDSRKANEADEAADVGFISGGNAGDFIDSDALSLMLENPTRDQLIEFARAQGLMGRVAVERPAPPEPHRLVITFEEVTPGETDGDDPEVETGVDDEIDIEQDDDPELTSAQRWANPVIQLLRGYSLEFSDSAWRAHGWYTETDPDENYRTGTRRTRSFRLHGFTDAESRLVYDALIRRRNPSRRKRR